MSHLGLLLLPGICRLLLSGLSGHALRTLGKVRSGLVVPKPPAKRMAPNQKIGKTEEEVRTKEKGAYQARHDRGVERHGLPFDPLFGLQLQHPAKATPDLVVQQILRRRTVWVRRAAVQPHRPRPLRQLRDPAMVEGVEHPHPVKAMLHKLLELLLNDLHLLLHPTGRAP